MKLPGLPRSWLSSPSPVIIAAVFLLIAGLAGALFSESDFRAQQLEQARAHARVLASSVSAALAFHDVEEATHAVEVLSAAPDVVVIGVYGADGSLFVGRDSGAGQPPARLPGRVTVYFDNGFAQAVEPVTHNATTLGWVYVRLSGGAGAARWMRYIGVGLLLLMSLLLLAILAAAQREQHLASQELGRRAAELARTNVRLSKEVAERQKAETALAHAQKMEAIGQLTGGVAHDFNNLLMVISSGLRLLETRDDERKRAAIVAAMQQAVERGANVTKQLLAFSRRQKLSPEVACVQERLRNLQPLLERSLREDIALKFDFRSEDLAVRIDPGQFDLAVLNVAVNARDAMPKGGELTMRVEKVMEAGAALAAVSVMDTGTGLSPEVRARAFDPFFSTKEVGKGTGLGLSQVYGFALQSGGRCELDSEPGRGTIVRLLLPVTDEKPMRAQRRAREETKGAGAVLMVEDDDSVSAMVGEMLVDLGYEVVRAANAQEALTKLADGAASVDIVFSDIVMPGGMSGIDLAREVKRRRPDLPILLTTGYGGHGELDTHDFPVLRKPYNREDLSTALARVAAA
jgi:signal transduction histidine kinase/CheY-like chemotaxis protein